MIKKSLICFLILFIIHALFVKLFPNMGMATNQRQDNILKAQQAFYAEDLNMAIVGTSLANRIIRDSIPNIQSLAFVGCSVEDGLQILRNRRNAPKYVFVEINLILRGGRKELVNGTTEGIIPRIKEWIPSLREQYEPICILASTIIGTSKMNTQAGMAVVDNDRLNSQVEKTLKDDKPIEDSIVKNRMNEIKSLVSELEAKGTKFVFFEMPINYRLTHMKSLDQIREVVRKDYPEGTYDYLPSDTSKYMTTDGQHLDLEGQKKYTHFFKQVTKKYKN